MRFTVINGMPYLVSNGTAYPVDINEDSVTFFKESTVECNTPGEYSLSEVRAKFGDVVEHKKTKRKKKAEE